MAGHARILANHFSCAQAESLAKRIGKQPASLSANVPAMQKPRDAYRVEVGERLRITAADLGYASALELAEHLGLERGAVDAWFNGRALPPVPVMVRFATRWGLTLDWIYKGDPAGLSLSRNIRLVAATRGERVPQAVRQEQASDEPEALKGGQQAQQLPRKPVRRRSRAIAKQASNS